MKTADQILEWINKELEDQEDLVRDFGASSQPVRHILWELKSYIEDKCTNS